MNINTEAAETVGAEWRMKAAAERSRSRTLLMIAALFVLQGLPLVVITACLPERHEYRAVPAKQAEYDEFMLRCMATHADRTDPTGICQETAYQAGVAVRVVAR